MRKSDRLSVGLEFDFSDSENAANDVGENMEQMLDSNVKDEPSIKPNIKDENAKTVKDSDSSVISTSMVERHLEQEQKQIGLEQGPEQKGLDRELEQQESSEQISEQQDKGNTMRRLFLANFERLAKLTEDLESRFEKAETVIDELKQKLLIAENEKMKIAEEYKEYKDNSKISGDEANLQDDLIKSLQAKNDDLWIDLNKMRDKTEEYDNQIAELNRQLTKSQNIIQKLREDDDYAKQNIMAKVNSSLRIIDEMIKS